MPLRAPDFLIAGSGECGTSWLYGCLLQHPQVYLPREMRPEPHFFLKSREYARGFDHYLDRWFRDVPAGVRAVGERSSSYIFGPDVPARIHEHLPGVKIVVMLREPVERAFSNWRFSVQSGLEPLAFEQALALEPARRRAERDPVWREIEPFAYAARSRYGEQIGRFRRFFPAEQMLILNSDAVRRDEATTLRRVCAFLGVDPGFAFVSPGSFPTSSVRSRRLQGWLRRAYGDGRAFDRAVEGSRRQDGPAAGRGRPWLDALLRANQSRLHPKLPPATRRELERALRPSNARLARFVDWDPHNWHAEF